MRSNLKFNLEKYKNLKFEDGLSVEENALLCPNPSEWYAKAYLSDNVEDFRLVPGVKEATKLANVMFSDTVLKAAGCPFTPNGSTLDAIDIDVCKFTVAEEVCQYDLEKSFVANQMLQGSVNWDEREFFAHYWEVLAVKVSEDIALTRWQGATGTGNDFVCEGYLDKILDSEDTIKQEADTFTVANIEDYFESALLALPNTVARKKTELRFYVSPSTANLIAIAMAKNNTTNYVTEELGMTYVGIKISVQEGMADDTIVLTRKDNLIYAFDGITDSENLRIRDLDVINEPIIRTRVDGKVGFHIVNDEEIVIVDADFTYA